MAATDILTIEEGRVAIGLLSTQSDLDDPLAQYVSAASAWLDAHMYEPAVQRDVDGTTVGRFPDTASVPPHIKQACTAYLQEIWRLYRGTPNSGFDDISAPFVLPNRILNLIPDDWYPGVV